MKALAIAAGAIMVMAVAVAAVMVERAVVIRASCAVGVRHDDNFDAGTRAIYTERERVSRMALQREGWSRSRYRKQMS